MRQITRSEVHEIQTKALGLDPLALDLTSVECIAGALRRAAGILCPCPPKMLVNSVAQALQHLADNPSDLRETIDSTLSAMVAYGDLVECQVAQTGESTRSCVLLYATPPSFVVRRDGSSFLLGVTPDNTLPLPATLTKCIEYTNHVRRLVPTDTENVRSQLKQFGLFELTMDQWLKAPSSIAPEAYIRGFDEALNAATSAGAVSDIRILDPAKPVRYYLGRWLEPRSHTGRFVGRRPQLYGADLWCYFEIEKGEARKLVDLPLFELRWRASDEAWRLQGALDAQRGNPQRYRIHPGSGGNTSILDLFSPVPLWMQRRWDYVGQPVLSTGCLFSYAIPKAALEEEIVFAKDKLWLQEL